MDLSFHNGDFKLNQTTIDDVTAVYGTPDYDNESSSTHVISYNIENDSDVYTEAEVRFAFDLETGKLTYVVIENEEKPSDFADEEVSDEEPEYLSLYTAPSSLGEDILSGNVSLEGKVYNVPVPLKVLMEDGWSIGGDETYTVGAGEGYSLSLTKGDKRINVIAQNPMTRATYIKYTIVTEISYYVSSYNVVDFEIAGGVTPSTTQTELDALLKDKGITNYDYNKTYGRYKIPMNQSESSDSSRNRVEFSIEDDGSMESMTVRNYGWLVED